MKFKYSPFLISILLLSGCQSSFGPHALSNTHVPYNQAIAESLSQQMLLNLVRLRYHDETAYLKISSVTSSLQLGSTLGIGSSLDLAPQGNIAMPSIGVNYDDTPTISYQPLEGEDFYKSVFTNLPLNKVFTLIATGWHVDTILGLCVDEINGVENAIQASSLTPAKAPKYQKYAKILSLLKDLQETGHLKIGPSKKIPRTGLIKFVETPENRRNIEALLHLLGLSPESRLIKIANAEFFDAPQNANANTLNIYTRSINGMLFYLSHNIQVPQEHLDQGLVGITKTEDGQIFDWGQTPGGKLLNVKVSRFHPSHAFLAVPYNDYWYYIENNDLQSKATFMLIMQLFDYQSGHSPSNQPTLTIPVK